MIGMPLGKRFGSSVMVWRSKASITRQYTHMRHGILHWFDQRQLPVCVCGEILDSWPDPNHIYIGFQLAVKEESMQMWQCNASKNHSQRVSSSRIYCPCTNHHLQVCCTFNSTCYQKRSASTKIEHPSLPNANSGSAANMKSSSISTSTGIKHPS